MSKENDALINKNDAVINKNDAVINNNDAVINKNNAVSNKNDDAHIAQRRFVNSLIHQHIFFGKV